MDERDYLRQEAQNARHACARSLKAATKDVVTAVDPRTFTGAHPWIAMLTAFVAGFVGGAVIVPSEKEQLLKKLRRMSRLFRKDGDKAEDKKSEPEDKQNQKGHGIAGIIGAEAIKLARPIIAALLTTGLRAATRVDPAADGQTEPAAAAGRSAASDAS